MTIHRLNPQKGLRSPGLFPELYPPRTRRIPQPELHTFAGEEPSVALTLQGRTVFFTQRGLEERLIRRQHKGLDTEQEEQALQLMRHATRNT